jgi:hypothetical protein
LLKIEVYPAMSGILVAMHGICTTEHSGIGRCHPLTVRGQCNADVIQMVGPLDAVYAEVTHLAREYGEVWTYATH